MQLQELMKQVKSKFMVDEQLRVYIYKDRIDFIDFTSAVVDKKGEEIVPDFYGRLFSATYRDKVITVVEPQSLSMITPRNTELYKYLCDLIYTKIDDLDSYPVIPENEHEDLAQTL